MYKAALLTYSHSPIKPDAFDDSILVLDEKFKDYENIQAEV